MGKMESQAIRRLLGACVRLSQERACSIADELFETPLLQKLFSELYSVARKAELKNRSTLGLALVKKGIRLVPLHMTIATEKVSESVIVNESDVLEGFACKAKYHSGQQKA